MKFSRILLCVLYLCWLFDADCMAGQPKSEQGLAPQPYVDERVELLSIVFRLAGNPEYHMDSLPAYSADIDRYFAAYKDHAAVKLANQLCAKSGVSFDAVMSMAISLSPPPELKPLVPFSATVPEKRWGVAGAEKFLPLLRDFYRDSKFAEFFAAHRAMYQTAEKRFAATLGGVDFGWYPRFYGDRPGLTYHLFLGMNNGGGNYGPRLIHPDGGMELFSIIGCWSHDDSGNPTYPPDEGYLATIIHEFNHSFVNPAVDEHWKEFSRADQVFNPVADQMRRMAYGNPRTMVYESLVRAAVIVYFQQAGEDSRGSLKRIREEQRNGFFWMDQLVDKLNDYEAQRAQSPTFSAYMPQIAQFYRELAPQVSIEAAAYDAKCVHVMKIEPFSNHSQDVDAEVKAITIVVDKPLDPAAGFSINVAHDQNPFVGKPVFEAGGLRISLPVELKPDQTYSFVLTPAAFATADGYPLMNYNVDFKTR